MNGSPLSASRSNSSFEKGFHRPSENTEEIRSFFLFFVFVLFLFGSSGEMRRGNNASDLLLKNPSSFLFFSPPQVKSYKFPEYQNYRLTLEKTQTADAQGVFRC